MGVRYKVDATEVPRGRKTLLKAVCIPPLLVLVGATGLWVEDPHSLKTETVGEIQRPNPELRHPTSQGESAEVSAFHLGQCLSDRYGAPLVDPSCSSSTFQPLPH